MSNLSLTFSPYILKLKSSFEVAHGKIKERKGWIISIKNPNGLEGIGDVSPFPEIGSESYEDAESALKNIKLNFKIDLGEIYKSFAEALKEYGSLPSLRHGIEQALLNLICKEKNLAIDKLLNLSLKNEIFANGIIGLLTIDQTINKIKELIEFGYKTFKLKAGRENFTQDFECIKAVRNEFGNDINLRIDVNGKWKLITAIKNLDRLNKFNIEYAEQPVNNLNDFIELSKNSSIPLAADESIRTKNDAANFINKHAVNYLILKPMMIGGLLSTLEIIELAEKNNIISVITSSFESAVGKTNAVIAAATVKNKIAHGLSTNDFYLTDVITDPFPVKDGKIHLSI